MTSTTGPQSQFDALIVGGGPIGLTLGLALERFLPGLRLGLLDRRPLSVPKDMRASAIASGGRHLFQALDLWEPMARDANPIARMHITDSASGDIARPVLLAFGGAEAPGDPIAHMVPNTVSAAVLVAAPGAGLRILEPGSVADFDGGGGRARVTLEDGRVIHAGLVIAADGGRSTLRTLAGIRTFTHDYRQSGVVTTIGHELAHDDVAYEHFRSAGPFASLPLTGNRSSLVWTEAPQRAAALLAMAPDDLALAIEAAMGSSLGAVTVLDAVQSFPLHLSIAHRSVAPRVALVGDAAHVIHPLAGQGLNLGLKDVAVLAETIVDAARLGEDIGSFDVLSRYERRRRADTAMMALATDGLNRLFSNDIAPVRALRDLGLSVVDRLGPLKDGIVTQAAGTEGARLLKGLPL